ncbi:MAG: 2-C-methyl-D-erythritol 2,4-cyclodiphosphate synthase [Chlamydiales bacterium]|nr:2-C-methyl-D-erythritol 2,4-cyclodiphosphate synthase [Chlamydiales bacterium]
MKFRTGIGQDSHRFLHEESTKPCLLGGIVFEDVPGFRANSDGDVIFHAICNAISSITGEIILGKRADELLEREGITDSSVYLHEALKTLGKQQITHVALTIEASRPKLLERIPELKENIAREMNLDPTQIGITATTGEGLTDFGCGLGLQCFCIITTIE